MTEKCHDKSFLASELLFFANKLDPPNPSSFFFPMCLSPGQCWGVWSLPEGDRPSPVCVHHPVLRVPAGHGLLKGLLAQPLDRWPCAQRDTAAHRAQSWSLWCIRSGSRFVEVAHLILPFPISRMFSQYINKCIPLGFQLPGLLAPTLKVFLFYLFLSFQHKLIISKCKWRLFSTLNEILA